MLRFPFDCAASENYPGVILIADKDTPAFGLYRRENTSKSRPGAHAFDTRTLKKQ